MHILDHIARVKGSYDHGPLSSNLRLARLATKWQRKQSFECCIETVIEDTHTGFSLQFEN